MKTMTIVRINGIKILVEGTENSEGRNKLRVQPVLGRITNLVLLPLSDVILEGRLG
jgi:hypothetical protein